MHCWLLIHNIFVGPPCGFGEEGGVAKFCFERAPNIFDMSMRCQVEGLACADPVARTPIGLSGSFTGFLYS